LYLNVNNAGTAKEPTFYGADPIKYYDCYIYSPWICYKFLMFKSLLQTQYLLWLQSMTTISRDSAVSIATGYGLDCCGVRVWVPLGPRFFSSPHCPGQFWGLHQPMCIGEWGKTAKCEADRSPPTSTEVKNTLIYTFTHQKSSSSRA
jgi:hypothetical protein